MKKLLAVLAALTLISLPGCGKNDSKITVVLDWTPNTNHTGLYAALELGYFTDEGLEVEIISDLETGALPLVAAGGADFGITAQEEMGAALSGENPFPVKAVAAILQHNTSGLLSLKSSGITSFAKLEGKKYATWDMPVEKAAIKYAMEKQGGDFSKVELIPSNVQNIIAALKSGDFDAIWIYYGWDGVASEMLGLDSNYLPFTEVDSVLDYYTPILASSDEYLKNNPEKTKKFLSAVAKGYEYCAANPEEAAEILCAAAPEIDPELVKGSMKFLADEFISDAPYFGYIDRDRWEAFFEWADKNAVPISEKAMKGFTNEYLRK